MADNNANRQLGIIQALRESVRVLKDHLTKISATEFDPNLVTADTLFRNDAQKFWFPSAESRFRDGVKALRDYVAGLKTDPVATRSRTTWSCRRPGRPGPFGDQVDQVSKGTRSTRSPRDSRS